MATQLVQGGMGTQGLQGLISEEASQLESGSISPKAIRKDPQNFLIKTYGMKEELLVTRFLIKNTIKRDLNPEIELPEREVFKRAIDYLKSVQSAAAILKATSTPPRSIQASNVVLVDIFDKSQSEENKFHTICLWKKTDQDLLIIDPSSYKFSSRLVKPLQQQLVEQQNDGLTINAKQHFKDKFYESLQKDEQAHKDEDGGKFNKDYRDCIDIAVKIAFTLNLSQRVAFDLSTIESRIDYLSNQKKTNDLLQGDEEAHIGWLQNSDACQREEAIRLLFENKDYIALVAGVKDIEALRELNFMRLSVVKSSNGYVAQGEFTSLIKDLKSKPTLKQFSKYLEDWKNILQKETEAKILREKLKEDVKESAKKQGEKK